MAWRVEFDDGARRDLQKLDKPIALRLTRFLRERVGELDDPRSIGDARKGSRLGDFWRYRVGDYRIICALENQRLLVLVLRVGHRREIYR